MLNFSWLTWMRLIAISNCLCFYGLSALDLGGDDASFIQDTDTADPEDKPIDYTSDDPMTYDTTN